MLVVGINHPPTRRATESTVFGPFFVDGRARRSPHGDDIANGAAGEPCWVSGTVADIDGDAGRRARGSTSGRPTRTASTTCSADGDEPAGRGLAALRRRTGGYWFWSVRPDAVPDPRTTGRSATCSPRPAAARCAPRTCTSRSTAPGYRTLITHMFVAGDEYLDSDAVFGVKRQPDRRRRRAPARAPHRTAARSTPRGPASLRHRPGAGLMTENENLETDVLIVGSGPAGGSARAVPGHLRRRQHGHHQVPLDGEHARARTSPTSAPMEIMRDIGIEADVWAKGVPHELMGETVVLHQPGRRGDRPPAHLGHAPGPRWPTTRWPARRTNCDLPQTLLEPIVVGARGRRAAAGSASTPSTSRSSRTTTASPSTVRDRRHRRRPTRSARST